MVEHGVARPRAADEQLVGGGQGVALPSCRVARRACGICEGRRASRPLRGCTGAIAVHAASRASVGMTGYWGQDMWGGAHVEYALNFADSGDVPAQRLVELERDLPRVRAGRGIQRQISGPQSAQGGAHPKHGGHVLDAGGVPAQRLVEGMRALPRVTSRAHGAGWAAGREAGGGGAVAGCARSACRGEGCDGRLGGRARS